MNNMKKITGIMLVVVLAAVLSVSAFAANAPLTAAEYFANRNITEDASTGGTIQFTVTEPLLPAFSAANDNAGLWSMNAAGDDLDNQIDISNNEFDVLVKFTTAKNYAGSRLYLFYNPEIVKPVELYQHIVYSVLDENNFNTPELLLQSLTGNLYLAGTYFTDASALYSGYLLEGKEDNYPEWQVALLDGETRMVYANGTNLPALQGKKYELARWPMEVVAADNNWYRTKLIGSYDQFANASNAISPVVADGGVMYFENENYTGPKIDIVGAMKKADGELRFGSVYFKDNGTHDNVTNVIETGVVLFPSALLEDTTLTLDTTYGEAAVITIPATGYYADGTNDEQVVYTGVLTGLAGYEDMYITARTYVKYMDGADEVVVYSDPIARSLDWVGDNTDMQ